MPRRLAIIVFASAALLAGPPPAHAAALCEVTIGDIDFGEVDTLSATDTPAAGTIRISCDGVSEGVEVVSLCASFGAGSGGSGGGARLLAGSSGALQYGLYADDGGGQPWGTGGALGTPQKIELPVLDGLATGNIWLYARVYGAQAMAAAGSYASTLGEEDVAFRYEEGDTLQCLAPGGQVASAEMSVFAEVVPNCLVSAGALDFGDAGIIDHNIDAAADISIVCTPGTGYAIALDGGTSEAELPERRLMHSGGDTVVYGLYTDPQRQQPWGSDLLAKHAEGIGEADIHTVYGRVPPQMAPIGTYADTVVVTIFYDD